MDKIQLSLGTKYTAPCRVMRCWDKCFRIRFARTMYPWTDYAHFMKIMNMSSLYWFMFNTTVVIRLVVYVQHHCCHPSGGLCSTPLLSSLWWFMFNTTVVIPLVVYVQHYCCHPSGGLFSTPLLGKYSSLTWVWFGSLLLDQLIAIISYTS